MYAIFTVQNAVRLCLFIHVLHLTYHICVKLNMGMNKKFARFNIDPFHSNFYLCENKVQYCVAFINAFAPVCELSVYQSIIQITISEPGQTVTCHGETKGFSTITECCI